MQSLYSRFRYGVKVLSRRFVGMRQGKKPLHLMHIGKTGGTAVRHTLTPYRLAGSYEIRLRGHHVRLHDIPVGHKVVFFLRDPTTRFVSGFYSRKRQGLPRWYTAWSPVEKVAFEEFSTPNELALALGSPDDRCRAKAEAAMHGIEHVKSLYGGWLGDADYLNVRHHDILFIGFQESLNEDFSELLNELGLPTDLALPHDEVRAHRTSTDVDKRLSEEAVANLRAWYREDYELVEFCRERKARMDKPVFFTESKQTPRGQTRGRKFLTPPQRPSSRRAINSPSGEPGSKRQPNGTFSEDGHVVEF